MAKSGDKIGPYTLVSKLGRGAFGVVWLAEKRTAITTTKVAIKIPNDEDVDLEAVRHEAALWVHASGHPNVLPLIDADIYDEQIVIVSEYAPDGSLSKWLETHQGRAPSIESAVEMTLGILSGLEHLHARGIIHRDLKPDNILLQRHTPRLADFGIARILKTTSQSTIATGTPNYMPPEAFDGKRSEQTDIWSVGVIFYQLLSGHLPFPQTEITALLGAIITREPEPLPATVPAGLQQLIKRALEKEPQRRYESAGEMREALRRASQPPAPLPAREVKTEVLPPALRPTVSSPTLPAARADEDKGASQSTDTPQLQLEYWTAFKDFLLRRETMLKPPKPQRQQWMPFALGRSNFLLAATLHVRDKRLGVNITISGPDAKAYYHLLHQQRKEIDWEIGSELDWRERPDGKESHIISSYDADPADRLDWPSQHAWLAEELESFHQAFASRIRELNLADHFPAEEEPAAAEEEETLDEWSEAQTSEPLLPTRALRPADSGQPTLRRVIMALLGAVVIALLVYAAVSYFWTAGGNSLSPLSNVEVTTATGLKYEDLVEGTGATAQTGKTLTVNYTGTLENGTKFDSSRDPGRQPLKLTLGNHEVIKGWEEGLTGMKVGGKRKLVVPADLGFGAAGRPPKIPGNSTLIFDVELLDVK
ncbi:MAG: DUF4268 domain-containing protein [Acidobacteria bacterium]|nr:DUF4268 domain-containing protein [Acidobacteriota bacterium]